MKHFSEDSKCPKCGDVRVTKQYVSGKDVIERHCQGCNCWWHELPLDVEAQAEAKPPPTAANINGWSYVPTGQYQATVRNAECWLRLKRTVFPRRIQRAAAGDWWGIMNDERDGYRRSNTAEEALDFAEGEPAQGKAD